MENGEWKTANSIQIYRINRYRERAYYCYLARQNERIAVKSFLCLYSVLEYHIIKVEISGKRIKKLCKGKLRLELKECIALLAVCEPKKHFHN